MSATILTGGEGPAAAARQRRRTLRKVKEAPIYIFLFACASLSIFTTIGIVLVLFEEAANFFGEVSIIDFLTGTEWTPLIGAAHFGILPLLNATIMMALGAMVFAVPLGLMVAIYLSEYAHPRVRSVIKPVLEVLAGIPTVVYGYFALTFITPEILQLLFGSRVFVFNALSASLAMARPRRPAA